METEFGTVLKNENMLVAFVNTELHAQKIRHICYFTQGEGEEITLCQTYEATYPHPTAPESAVVQVIQTRSLRTMKRSDYKAAHLLLLEANQKNCRSMEVSQ